MPGAATNSPTSGRAPGLDCGDLMETCCLSALRGPHAPVGARAAEGREGPGEDEGEGLHPLTPRLGRQPFPGLQTGLSAYEAVSPAGSGIMTLTCPPGLPKGVSGCIQVRAHPTHPWPTSARRTQGWWVSGRGHFPGLCLSLAVNPWG